VDRATAYLQQPTPRDASGCPYGDGQASLRIVEVLHQHLGGASRSGLESTDRLTEVASVL
jgi:UDP-N-acetylglucosamine 2-epimerase